MSVFSHILNIYKSFLTQQQSETNSDDLRIKLTQNQSLQALFDLKFLYALFDLKSSSLLTNNSTDPNDNQSKLYSKIIEDFKSVCSLLESFIDPFDYDICTPFMQSNIAKSISRSVTLYGILSLNERNLRNLSNTSSSITAANEKFNLLVLCNSQHRFELLPLASQQQTQQLQNQAQSQSQSLKFKNQTSLDEKTKKSLNKSDLASSGSSSANSASGLFGFKWFQ